MELSCGKARSATSNGLGMTLEMNVVSPVQPVPSGDTANTVHTVRLLNVLR